MPTNYSNLTNDQIVAELDTARRIFPSIQKALDKLCEFQCGRLYFDDIRDAVAIYVNRETNPALFEACVRIGECENVVTIPA